ncbi:MAG: hypothetical protein P4L22_06680 [Candidatus Babeliales bacterium]|nr:hypothetical protein [Candidatus Babeliales bacterium]
MKKNKILILISILVINTTLVNAIIIKPKAVAQKSQVLTLVPPITKLAAVKPKTIANNVQKLQTNAQPIQTAPAIQSGVKPATVQPVIPVTTTCTGGQILTKTGCQCPPGRALDYNNNCTMCPKTGPTKQIVINGICSPCQAGATTSDGITCTLCPNRILDRDGNCCPNGLGPSDECCPDGLIGGVDKRCCPKGQLMNYTTNQCVDNTCSDNQYFEHWQGTCQPCPAGLVSKGGLICCPPNSLNPDGTCSVTPWYWDSEGPHYQ